MTHRKPSLSELERLLNSEDNTPVTINPDGSVTRNYTMMLKDLTIMEKRDLVYLAAHRAGESLARATAPDYLGNINEHGVKDAIIQFRIGIKRVLDLIEELGLESV